MRRENDNEGTDAVPCECQAEKMEALSRLSAAVSHKVNNPLTYVLNYIFILKSTLSDEKTVSTLKKVEQGLNRAKDVLHELVDMSCPSSESQEVIDLGSCIKEGMSAYFSELSGKGVSVDTEFEAPATATASKKGILKAIMILVENSVEAGASNIAIRARGSGEGATIDVEDNGCGIREEHLNLVFEPFFTTKPFASGLGLYLAYHQVRSFGGRLCVEAPRAGVTTFRMTLQTGTSA
jgi:signal transduction histidine kinase